MGMLILSFVAVPAVMLTNCWVLFVSWRGRAPLIIAGLLVPSYVGAAMTIFIHGTRGEGNVGGALLTPFFMILVVATAQPLATFAIWLLAMIAFVLRARAILAHR